ncbi:MAG: hypothetical protein ACI89E_001647 [Planctomycetota bacterium]|jgi:hypothetical protein
MNYSNVAVWMLALSASAAAPLFAQDKDQDKAADVVEVIEAKAKSPALMAFEALEKDADATSRTWMEAYRAAEPEVRKEMGRSPFKEITPKFEEGAAKYVGTAGAVPYLGWLVQNAGRSNPEIGANSFMTLLRSHGMSPELSRIASMLPDFGYIVENHKEEAINLITTISKSNPNALVRGYAAYGILKPAIEKNPVKSKEYMAAKAALLTAMKEADDKRFSKKVHSTIDVREKFGIGIVAPDITGADLNGVEFKLSDYRGKVIFLDFWGNW